MDWKDIVGPVLQASAPTLGGLLGGLIPFPGGAMMGQELGTILANQFGVPATPEAVNNAIQNTPSDLAAQKIAAAEAEATAKWPALAQIGVANAQSNASQADSINATMKAELAAGQRWYAWRNLYGYSVVIEVSTTSLVLVYGMVFDAYVMKNFMNSMSFILSWYGLRFGLLGFVANAAANEKVAAVTGEAPGIVKNIAKIFGK
jgi:hypothetical protein